MNIDSIIKDIQVGETPDATQPIHMELSGFRTDPATGRVVYRVVLSGPMTTNKERTDASLFGAIRMGFAGLRQLLRHIQRANPNLKFYDQIDGALVEQSVDDLFWTHDCVPERTGG
ncbi:hypothetical protein [Arenimonas sp.]|uniref:hypothetical protein n=1 Tax=Arenimonas sp. TaxID=1872635 RepID=UPI0039E23FD3